LTASRSPDYYLHQLDSENTEIRWRAASDLAQILKRPEAASQQWKADPHFALGLAERLRKALDELARTEAETEAKLAALPTGAEQDAAWRRLAPQRHHVSYLAAALGDLHVPVGVPLIAEICLKEESLDLKGNTMQRRKAMWSLCNLGNNARSFAKLPSEKQAEILDALHTESAGNTPRAAWAATALFYLDTARPATPAVVHVDDVLARCASSQDRNLRELVAHTFHFWDGPGREPTLLNLAQDDGFGTNLRVTEID
jgi:hypothetical protein